MHSRMPGMGPGLYRLFLGLAEGPISIQEIYRVARSMIRSTLCACQRPPLGVAMPRAANSAAIRRADEFRLRMFESRADMIYGHVPIPITDWLRENATRSGGWRWNNEFARVPNRKDPFKAARP
jgi:hypothetical protein